MIEESRHSVSVLWLRYVEALLRTVVASDLCCISWKDHNFSSSPEYQILANSIVQVQFAFLIGPMMATAAKVEIVMASSVCTVIYPFFENQLFAATRGMVKVPAQWRGEMTTPRFCCACVQLGLSMADLEMLSIGLINDMYSESRNDDYKYAELATQEDFDRF